MKTVAMVVGMAVCWCGLGAAFGQQLVPLNEAGGHVGQDVAVVGTVDRVELQPDGNVRILFQDADAAHGVSVLVIKGTGLDADPRLSFVPHHRLEVKGKVELDQDRPEIKVSSRDQLTTPNPGTSPGPEK